MSTLTASTSASTARPSEYGGMGALLHHGGASFRVWAPFAEHVWVVGDFNDWEEEHDPLAHEEGGYWSTFVRGAHAGQGYKFVIQREGVQHYRNDPYARQVTNSVGHSLIYDDAAFDWEGDDFHLAAWNELVIYELHVGTFNDQNPDGPGDLSASMQRFDYLRDLGVNAIEVMPLAEFAGDYSWGYNPAHPFAVESAYGGPDAFKQFVKEAHRNGLGVILDVVYNHFGPTDLDLWRFDGWGDDPYGGIYFFNDERANTPWGATRPDYGRHEVRRYIRDNVMMWLESYHVDGLRWDGTIFIRDVSFFQDRPIPEGWTLMQEILGEVEAKMPHKLMIAEDLQRDPALTRPVEAGGAGFDMQWCAQFVHPVRAALATPNDEHRDLGAVAGALLHRYNDDAFERIIYTESHDETANGRARLTHEIDADDSDGWAAQKRSTLGAALVFTAPGVPMLFQGQALLEDEWFRDTDPVDWSLLEAEPGINRLYRDLIALRRNHHETTRGLMGQHTQIVRFDPEAKILAYVRRMEGGPGDDTLVVANLSHRPLKDYRLGLPRPGLWRLRLNSDWGGYSSQFADHAAFDFEATGQAFDEQPASGLISVGSYTALIFSQDS